MKFYIFGTVFSREEKSVQIFGEWKILILWYFEYLITGFLNV